MNKKLSLVLILSFIFSFTSLSAFEINYPTKDILGLSYSQNFTLRNVYAEPRSSIKGLGGAFKYQRSMFFNNFPMGFGFTFDIGGPFFYSITDKNSKTIKSIKCTDLTFGLNNSFGLGFAFDIPLFYDIALNIITGPSFDIMMARFKNQDYFSFQFGPFVNLALRFNCDSKVQFMLGSNMSYSFLQAGYIKSEGEKEKLSTVISSFDIKPFIGLCIKMDSFYDSIRKSFNL